MQARPSEFDLAEYPDRPGFKGQGETGRDAAEDMAPKVGRLQRMTVAVIAASGTHGLTADEAAEALGMDRWSIQPRTSECRAKGLICDSGQRRFNGSGKKAIVWVTPEHRQSAAA